MKTNDLYKGFQLVCDENNLQLRVDNGMDPLGFRGLVGFSVRDKWESGNKHLVSFTSITRELCDIGAFELGRALALDMAEKINEKNREIRFARLADR